MTLLVERLVKRLGGRPAVDGVSLELRAPGVVALVGDNGAGKSTLLRVAAGVLAADEGRVRIDERSIDEPEARRSIGYVPEGADPLPELTLRELLSLCASLKRAPLVPASLLERLGVSQLLRQRVGSMSLGQRRRSCLAAALTGSPSLLLLDEPTNGLDPEGVELLGALIREHRDAGGLTLFATHDFAFAQSVGATVHRMAHGRLVA